MFQRNGRLLHKRFAEYFIPTVLMAVALSMSIVVDGIIVGNMLGPEALAAVNLGSPLIMAYSAAFCLFGIGGSILVAFYKGKRDHAAADAVFTVSCLCLALFSLAFAAAGLAFREELAVLLSGGNAALTEPVLRFITPLLYGCPLLIMVPGLVYFIRTDGRPKLAALALIAANVINLGCDVAFIALLGDIQAAGIATVTGYALGGCLLFVYALSKRRGLRFVAPGGFLRLSGSVVKAGLPSGLSMLFTFIKIFCINRLVLSIAGETGMVAFSVCIACWSLASMFIAGASQTMMPMIGVLSGEGDFRGIRFVFRRALTVLMVSSVALLALLELFPGGILRFFGVRGAEQLAMGIDAIRLFALCLPGMAFTFLMLYYAQTMRRQSMALAITAIEGVAVVVPVAWLLSRLMGLPGVWIAFSVAEMAAVAAIFVMARHARKTSGGTLKGLLMLPEPGADAAVLDVTIRNLVEEAVTLSEAVTCFCRDNGLDAVTAARLGLAVEEMAVNTARHGGGVPGENHIDIAVSIRDGEVRVSFRDDGRPFNPAAHADGGTGAAECSAGVGEDDSGGGADDSGEPRTPQIPPPPVPTGIALIRAVAERLDYAYTLGFNTTTIVIKNPGGSAAR